jgi:hypothetical protein
MDIVFGFALLLGVPLAYAWVQVLLLRRWVGGWRLAAALPLAGCAVWAVNFAWDVTSDATSHNLFPFEILIGAGVALLYLGCLAALRRMVAGPVPGRGQS